MAAFRQILVPVCLTIAVFTACDRNASSVNDDTIVGNGVEATAVRYVSDFHNLSLTGSFDVDIDSSQNDSVRITTDSNLLDQIATDITGTTLDIRPKCSISCTHGIRVRLGNNHLSKLAVSGDADVVILRSDVSRFVCTIEGNGTIAISGRAENNSVTVRGNAVYDAFSFASDTSTVNIEGNASVHVCAARRLIVTLTGLGSVVYTGDPEITTTVTGLGTITRKE